MPRSLPTRLTSLAAVAALCLGAAACGDDDGGTAPPDGAPTADLVAYCEDEVALDQVFQRTDADDPETFGASLAEGSRILDRLQESRPDAVAEDLDVLAATFAEVVETQDPEPFFTEEVTAAGDAVHAHDVDACGWTVSEIGAEDYHYTGDLPTEAGTVSFEVANHGAEPHLLLVGRKRANVEGTAREAFDAIRSEEELPASFDDVLALFVAPGDSDSALAELAPGEYVAYCPLPTGTTGETPGDGAPHFTQGMVTTFEVR